MRLNLGCGTTPRQGWVNIDCRALPGVDVVRDVLRGLPFSDDSVDEIESDNFLEHIPATETIWIMNEMHRVLRSGGTAKHTVPVAGSVLDFQDPTHLSHWNESTFSYFAVNHHRNKYYGGEIKPWKMTRVEPHPKNADLLVAEMEKP